MTVRTDVPLAPLTTLGIGGPARRLVMATTRDELVAGVRQRDAAGEPALVLAGGSNVVLPDAGVEGTVVLVATRGVDYREDGAGDVLVTVEAGEPWDVVVAAAVEAGLAGVECLSGIPGSTGATPVQNVGAYGQEVADTLVHVDVLDRRGGQTLRMTAADCGFGYRTSVFKHDDRFLVLGVTFRLQRTGCSRPVRYAELARALGIGVGATAPVAAVREAVLGLRRRKGMVVDAADPDSRSAGSFFTNPLLTAAAYDALRMRARSRLGDRAEVPCFAAGPGEVKVPAAWLIERVGFGRGYGAGPVGISTKHTLALVNRGGGTAADLLRLAREIRGGVQEAFEVVLRPEPVIVGARL